jgi:hypothetical protein
MLILWVKSQSSQDLRVNIVLGPSCEEISAAFDVIFLSTTLHGYDLIVCTFLYLLTSYVGRAVA